MKINNFSLQGASLDGIILATVKIMTTGLGLITTRLLSQYLSIFDYGTYSLIQLVVSSTVSITILGMMDGINYFSAAKRWRKTRRLYRNHLSASVFCQLACRLCDCMRRWSNLSLPWNSWGKKIDDLCSCFAIPAEYPVHDAGFDAFCWKGKSFSGQESGDFFAEASDCDPGHCFVGSVGIILFMTCILDAAQIIVFFFMLKKADALFTFGKLRYSCWDQSSIIASRWLFIQRWTPSTETAINTLLLQWQTRRPWLYIQMHQRNYPWPDYQLLYHGSPPQNYTLDIQ